MIGKYAVVAVEFLLMACGLFSREATGFLFPDLLALRIGYRVQSRYKIAVLQEEPFLFANGTGYVPELLRLVGDWYASTSNDNDTFPYDINPVNTWSQLMTKASVKHWQVSYGLVASSLLRSEGPWKSMQTSMATLQTGLKMVTSKKAIRTTNSQTTTTTTMTITAASSSASTTAAAASTATTSTHTTNGSRGQTLSGTDLVSSYHAGNRMDLKGASVVTLDGSPLEQLLKRSPRYRQFLLETVQTNDEALSYVRQNPNVFLVKDSAAVRGLLQQHGSELATVCPKKSLLAGAQLYYGFFGRDQSIVQFLNEALRKLRNAEHDSVRALNAKYFGHIRTCP